MRTELYSSRAYRFLLARIVSAFRLRAAGRFQPELGPVNGSRAHATCYDANSSIEAVIHMTRVRARDQTGTQYPAGTYASSMDDVLSRSQRWCIGSSTHASNAIRSTTLPQVLDMGRLEVAYL